MLVVDWFGRIITSTFMSGICSSKEEKKGLQTYSFVLFFGGGLLLLLGFTESPFLFVVVFVGTLFR